MSKINVSVDCVIFGFDDVEKKVKVLTIEKKVNPFSKQDHKKTQFAIPGDLIEIDEDIDDAANRILLSLTKLDNLYLKQFKTFGNPTRVQEEKDKEWLENFRANPNERVITIGYVSIVRMEDYNPQASYFAHNVCWTDILNIPEKLLGRIFAIISVSILSMTAVSSGIIGFLAEFMTIHEIFLLFGLLAGLCGIVGLLHPKVRYLN